MCTTCGCGDTELVPVELHEKILAGNDRTATHNREHFRESGVLALNIMGSPGSGKTAVLEATARVMKGVRLGAVSADLATDNDAQRLSKAGIPSKAITTGQACHLDAELVHRSLHDFPWRELDVFFIENVGNLVCPAIYDLGQEANVVARSVTEGEDNLRRVMPDPKILRVSARTGEGMDGWRAWIEQMRAPILGGKARAAQMQGHEHEHPHEHEHAHEHTHGGQKHSHTHSHQHAHSHEHDGPQEKHQHGSGEHGHDGSGHDHSH